MNTLRKPLLLILAAIIILGMLRLGIWQMSRADEKQAILDQQVVQSDKPAVDLVVLLNQPEFGINQRFRPVRVTGQYRVSATILVDNQLRGGENGYLVFTPFQISANGQWVMVNRGWVPIGQSRDILPNIRTSNESLTLIGRLNTPPPRPPMLSRQIQNVAQQPWPYLSLDEVTQRFGVTVLPLVVELAPNFTAQTDPQLQRQWVAIDDKWVAKHHAYAVQWFAMALTLLVISLILLLRSAKRPKA